MSLKEDYIFIGKNKDKFLEFYSNSAYAKVLENIEHKFKHCLPCVHYHSGKFMLNVITHNCEMPLGVLPKKLEDYYAKEKKRST